ncbi:MAG: hypothetical protein ACK5TH_20980 [Prosthecobacter sp.]|jgi:hypothetical protein
MKQFLKISILALAAYTVPANAAVTIAHPENGTVGAFLDSTGAALAAGGVSVGYFSSAVSDSQIQALSAGTAFSDLIALGYRDVRNAVGATLAGGFDWAFPTVAGTVQNIPIGTLPQGTQLYVIAFNAGSYVAGTAGTPSTTSTSFAGATEWAVVKDAGYTGPADSNTRSLLLSAASGSEILVGTDNGVNVNLAAAVPEPTKGILSIAAMALIGLRRRR